jgi:protein-disulfide isomerase
MNTIRTRRSIINFFPYSLILSSIATLKSLPALADGATLAALLQNSPLGDVWLGSPSAKITIIEYASLTCPHCASFHKNTWPLLKTLYVDTGKVRFTLREFPLDLVATAAFMISRCEGAENYYKIIDILLKQQAEWAFVKKSDSPVDAMARLLTEVGFTKAKFDLCLRNSQIYSGINFIRDRAINTFKVEKTPTFFINESKYVGEMDFPEIKSHIENEIISQN